MITIFIEYKVEQGVRNDYLLSMDLVQERLQAVGVQAYQFLEATDQENLYVETFQLDGEELYHRWKQEISAGEDTTPWSPIFPYIKGGKGRFNMWSFKPVPIFKGSSKKGFEV